MTSQPFTHNDFLQRVDVYVAGGLIDDEAERLAFEAHAANCPTCAAALAAAREHDMTMVNLFGDVRPGERFEDRLLGALRGATRDPASGAAASSLSIGRRAVVHPIVRRAAVGVAAAILLGGVGLVAERAMTGDGASPLQALHLPAFLGGSPGKDAPAGGEGNSPATWPADFDSRRGLQRDESHGAHFYAEVADHEKASKDETLADAQRLNRLEAINGRGGGERGRVPEPGGASVEFREDAASAMLGVREYGVSPARPERNATISSGTRWDDSFGSTRSDSGVERTKGEDANGRGGSPTGSIAVGAGGGGGFGGGGGDRDRGFGNGTAPVGGPAAATTWAAQVPGTSAPAGGGDFVQAPDAAGARTGVAAGTVKLNVIDGTVANPVAGGAVEGANVAGTQVVPQLNQSAADDSLKNMYSYQAPGQKSAGGVAAAAPSPSTELYFKLTDGPAGRTGEFKDSLGERGEAKFGRVLNETHGDAKSLESLAKAPKDSKSDARRESGARATVDEVARVGQDAAKQPADEFRAKAAADGGKPGEVAQDVGARQALAVADPAAASTTPPNAPDPVRPATVQQQQMQRKIIRNGDVTFEVDGFDSSLMQITKIAAEEGGFVATTDSEKLPNGKVKGTVTVRVPPDRLDTLVLKLRGLGDLKSSRLAANDVTKLYTDLDSQLTAAKAMHERLLGIIKDGKGAVKDLLEAEKQLGVWREKIERLQGEINYYNNLVSLSTLNVTLYERDIRTSGLLTESETVDMGVETDDVEKARAEAIKAIEGAKGRIINSDLKRHDAGQYVAKIDADVTPEQAGAVIDRLKQLGRVGRLDVQRRQTTAEGTPPIPGAKVERKDTRLSVSIYNLANIAPRVSTTLNLAAEDVEVAYKQVLDQVKGSGGRIVTSQLNRPRPDQTTGTITFETPTDVADVLLGAVRGAGEVMRLDVTQNPDTQNTTDAKRGFAVQVFSLASVAPRETTSLTVATRSVPDTFAKVRDAVRAAGSRVLTTQLNEGDPNNVSGQLDFETKRADWPAVDAALRDAGLIVTRQVARSADTENTVDTKIRMQVSFIDEARLAPAETVTMQLAVSDVPTQYAKILDAVRNADARVLDSRLDQAAERNNVSGTLVIDVRRGSVSAVNEALAKAGDVVSRNFTRATTPQPVQDPKDEKVRLSLQITDADLLSPRETTSLDLEVEDVDKAVNDVRDKAVALGGRLVDFALKKERNGRVMGRVVVDVPLAKAMEMVVTSRDRGRLHARRDTRNEQVPDGTLARARIDVQLMNADPIVANDKTLGSSVRSGLSSSMNVLLGSVRVIVFGLCVILPWVLVVWLVARWYGRAKRRRAATTTPGGTTPPPPTIVPPAPA